MNKLSSVELSAPIGMKEQVLLDTGLADGYVRVSSAVGTLNVAFSHNGVSAIAPETDTFATDFSRRFSRPAFMVDTLPDPLISALPKALSSGRLSRVSIDWRGQTDFQRSVLEAAASIPVGEVRPYGWIATTIGRPNAVRAVGSALGQNPVPVLVPCHRVVKSDGTLGDYRFGAEMKETLLQWEGLTIDPRQGVLVGDDRRGIVCYPSCRVAKRIAQRHQRWFKSAAQARKDDYRPCQKCRPIV